MDFEFLDNVYFMGGSTCCGKSSIAEMICENFDCYYYKLDDALDEFMKKMAEDGHELAKETLGFSMEEMWMREPEKMCEDEIEIYAEVFDYALEALKQAAEAAGGQTVIAEGAGFMPALMNKCGVKQDHYICMVPVKAFQIKMYEQRPWIGIYLEGTSDPGTAFSHWMERDVLFAARMKEEAEQLGYNTLVVDGSLSLQDNYLKVVQHFGL